MSFQHDRTGRIVRVAQPPGAQLCDRPVGTATFYMGADPKCRAHGVRAGSGFVDKGRAVHIVRNEGTVTS